MPDQKEKTYIGILTGFAKNTLHRGRSYGFAKANSDEIADALLHLEALEKAGIPVPTNLALLEGQPVQYTVTPGKNGKPRVASIKLIGEPIYDVSKAWRGAAPEIAATQVGTSNDIDINGTVRWFNKEKNFGFIIPDDGGKDVLVSKDHLPEGVQLLEGMRVKFSRKRNISGGEFKGYIVDGLISMSDDSTGGLKPEILSMLAGARVFKKADLTVIWYNVNNRYGFAVEVGADPADQKKHIIMHKNDLATYLIPNIDWGMGKGQTLSELVFWEDPNTGKLSVLPKAYEKRLNSADRPARANPEAPSKDRAPGES